MSTTTVITQREAERAFYVLRDLLETGIRRKLTPEEGARILALDALLDTYATQGDAPQTASEDV